MMNHAGVADTLAATSRSLRDQQRLAKELAATLARLSDETNKLGLHLQLHPHDATTAIGCNTVVEIAKPDVVQEQPMPPSTSPKLMDARDLMPGCVAAGTGEAAPNVADANNADVWGQPESLDAECPQEVVTEKNRASSRGSPKTSRFRNVAMRSFFQGVEDAVVEKKHQGRMFADPEELREQIREHLTEEPYSPDKFYKATGCAQRIARHYLFEAASLILVIFSSIWITVDMDSNESVTLHGAAPIFQVVAHLSCLFFLVEVVIRMAAFQRLEYAFKDRWCVFDMVLVSLLVLETWILGTVAALSGKSLTGGLKLMVVFRVLRLLRVLRLGRVFQHLPELMVIIRGLGIALRAIAVVLSLLGVIVYVGAIIFRGILEGTDLGAMWFPDVLTAMGTLLLDCTLSGTRGTPLMREAYQEGIWYALALLLFVLLANVTMMGVLAGLLVQTVKTVAEVEKEEKSVKELVGTMEKLWSFVLDADVDNSRSIDEAEFRSLMSIRETAKILHHMDIDVDGLVNLSSFFFEQHQGKLTRKDFMKMVLDLRGGKKATVKDHVETRKFLCAELKRVCHYPVAEAIGGATLNELSEVVS